MWKGLAYPIKATEQGLYKIERDDELIKGNIKQILGTRRGERVMLPRFGTRLWEYIFDPIDNVTAQFLRTEIKDALREWEPRVTVLGVDITQKPGEFLMHIRITYRTETGSSEKTVDLTVDKNGGDVSWA